MPTYAQTFPFDQTTMAAKPRTTASTASTQRPTRSAAGVVSAPLEGATGVAAAVLAGRRQGRRFRDVRPVDLYREQMFCFGWSFAWLRSWFDHPEWKVGERHRNLRSQWDMVDALTSEYWGATASDVTGREEAVAARLGLSLGSVHFRDLDPLIDQLGARSAPGSGEAVRAFSISYDWVGGGAHAAAMFMTGRLEVPAVFFDSLLGESKVTAADPAEHFAAVRLLVERNVARHGTRAVKRYTYRTLA